MFGEEQRAKTEELLQIPGPAELGLIFLLRSRKVRTVSLDLAKEPLGSAILLLPAASQVPLGGPQVCQQKPGLHRLLSGY